MIGKPLAAIALAGSLAVSCVGEAQVEEILFVYPEMPTEEFNNQAIVANSSKGLDKTISDFWGTDEAHQLVIRLSGGDINFEAGGSVGGTMIASTPISNSNVLSSNSKIRTITFFASRSRLNLSDAQKLAATKCSEIEKKAAADLVELNKNFDEEVSKLAPGDASLFCKYDKDKISISLNVIRLSSTSYLPDIEKDYAVSGWVGRI